MSQAIITNVATPIPLTSRSDAQLCELRDQIGDEGMDALIRVDQARTARQEAEVKEAEARVKTFIEKRENLAFRCEEEFPLVAEALRGLLPPTEAVKALNKALKNRAFGPEAADTLERVRDLAITAEVSERKDALAKREAIVAMQVTKVKAVIAAFYAHAKVGNIGGMEATRHQLRQVELAAGLIAYLGGVEERGLFFASVQEAITLATKVKDQPKAKGPKPERVGPKQSQRGTGKPRS